MLMCIEHASLREYLAKRVLWISVIAYDMQICTIQLKFVDEKVALWYPYILHHLSGAFLWLTKKLFINVLAKNISIN